MTIKNLLKKEEKFRKELMKVKPTDPLEIAGTLMLLNQSYLFSIKLEKYLAATEGKKE